ncbi:MAG: hypothetical protein EAZ32_06700 [Cytophagia bacterium]|nr:MAG: hypothetical protein EAZ38_08975 [Cytophagales bacterium]TAG40419.1 MAG: hypothetical protein EAZ32_06700 [Cytophagia bacterium]TAG51149.1 MAG: hypothetical protein EAZ29_10530 [Runella slithyformis]TAG81980.1 MAG: hypothetical protein EAZ22_06120 [Cytophagales bacterium]
MKIQKFENHNVELPENGLIVQLNNDNSQSGKTHIFTQILSFFNFYQSEAPHLYQCAIITYWGKGFEKK